MNLSQIVRAVVETIRDPRSGAKMVMSQNVDRRQRWEILLLIAVLSGGLAYTSILIGGLFGNGTDTAMGAGPFVLAITQAFVLLGMVFLIHIVGTKAGGLGSLDDAILLVAWMQFILICLQIIQIMAVVAFPVLAVLLGLAGFVLIFVLLTVFISELHGFRSLPGVFFSVLFVMLISAIAVRFLFGLFGFDIIGIL
ncbi:MAG: YIP1 family protein [Paracoccaceae bacterium]